MRGWSQGPRPPLPLQLWWSEPGPLPKRPTDAVTPTPSATTPVRIGDVERDQAVSELGDHFAAGRLNRDEFDERIDQAMQARFNGDLEPLFADLPRPTPTQDRTADVPAKQGGLAKPVGGPPPLAYALWLLPFLMVAMVAGAVLLHAPFLIWMLVWFVVMGNAFGHRHQHHRRRLDR